MNMFMDEFMWEGEWVYNVICVVCYMFNGEGLFGVFFVFKGSKMVLED